ncbi:hypothetical protein D3C87_267000 [compost metagenome]
MLQYILVLTFTLLIHSVESLSYAVRLGGLRTGRIALAMSLTGIIVLISRTSNMGQGILLGGMIDTAIRTPEYPLGLKLHLLILAATVGTLIAAVLFPTMTKISARLVVLLDRAGSLPKLLKSILCWDKIKKLKAYYRPVNWKMAATLRKYGIPKKLMLINMTVTTVYTVGVLAALYASYLLPETRLAASMSSGLINGIATILLTLLIDPRIAVLSDRTLRNQSRIGEMDRLFGLMLLSRGAGTLLAQCLLLPAAYWIGFMIHWIN